VPTRNRVTPKERLDIMARIASGETDAQIALALNRHRSTVSKIRSGAQKKAVTTNGSMIHARIADEELEAFREFLDRRGLTISDGVRRLIRHSVDALDLQSEEIEAVLSTRKALNDIGRNLNQLVKLGNAGRLNWNARDGKLVDVLDQKVDDLTNQMIAFVSAARKRTFVRAAFPIEGPMND